MLVSDGGAEGSQTPDLRNANAALYQLSYSPVTPNYTSGEEFRHA